jgi:hypothetical protein
VQKFPPVRLRFCPAITFNRSPNHEPLFRADFKDFALAEFQTGPANHTSKTARFILQFQIILGFADVCFRGVGWVLLYRKSGGGKNASQSRGQVLGGMFQSNHRERLPVPTIEERKNWESRHGDAENVGQIRRFKTGGMAASRIFQ